MLKVFLAFSLTCTLFTLRSQDRCGTVAYEKLRSLRNPKRETTDQFESWISEKLIKKSQAFSADRVGSNYVVPIVVHVIHNGEAEGTGSNISDAQILSQITVLNNDFQRLNGDAVNTPSEFVTVAGQFPITFVMAQQDPDGITTTGIVRVKGTQTSWDISDNYTFKALSYWPAEDYLNIWVVNLTGGLLGYTQLPVSSTLQGLSDSSNDRLTDGVVIDYSAYGAGSGFDLQSKYNLGRTATHEVGHFFGLRHVWGDVNSCDPSVSTDYVSDTPIQNTDYNGLCPDKNTPQIECGVHTMFDNYLNYTDDACMNIFSKGQVDRMDVVINNSPRRLSLLTSPGSQPPSPVANDLGIKSIVNPGATACSGNLIPSVTIHNYGTNNVTSAKVQFLLGGNPMETSTFSLNLTPNNESTISFSPVALNAGTSYNFSFTILQTNGVADGNNGNDAQSTSTQIPVAGSLPLLEPFTTIPAGKMAPAGWLVANPDELTTWAPDVSNHSMYLNFYDYENSGASDLLVTPVLDLTTATVASLNFDHAYAQYQQGDSSDILRVLVSSVCDFNKSPVEIFARRGAALATVSPTSSSFIPASSGQWVTSIVSLNQFLGEKIQIAFDGVNGYGNNLYLDNVSITNVPITSFALNGVVSPSPVSCASTASPIISVTNLGNNTITSFTVNAYLNDHLTVEQISGIQLGIGATANVTLSPMSFAGGTNRLAIAIKSPNGSLSPASSDSLQTSLIINSSSDFIPLRENFDGNFVDRWSTINPQSGEVWQTAVTNTSKFHSMKFASFGNIALGQQAWLVSPVLDFSKAQGASVNFETSYAVSTSGMEALQVFSSRDCGVTFDSLLISYPGDQLSNVNSNTAWTPADDTQWTKRSLPLNNLAGKENVRFAFVATNGNGNNLYIDNIEFFMDDLHIDKTDGLYSVWGGAGSPLKVTFNLPERELVRMQVYDLLGHVVSDNLLPDTLNQTYEIKFPEESRGMYVVRIQTATTLTSTKVLMGF